MACNDWNSALQGDPDASLTPVQSNLMTREAEAEPVADQLLSLSAAPAGVSNMAVQTVS